MGLNQKPETNEFKPTHILQKPQLFEQDLKTLKSLNHTISKAVRPFCAVFQGRNLKYPKRLQNWLFQSAYLSFILDHFLL